MTKKQLSGYFAKIGAKGGKKSRRVLTSEQAKQMVAIRISKQDKKAKL
jgi:hypothetical protein